MRSADELDREIKKLWGPFSCYDGIVDIDRFNRAKHRILWILKEPNADDSDLHEWNQREFHKNKLLDYSRWQSTYANIIYASYCIIHEEKRWDDIDNLVEKGVVNLELVDIMKDIAFINVKKTAGGSVSNNNEINEAYLNKRDFLLKQIDAINPNIIINASRVDQLSRDLCPEYKQTDGKNYSVYYGMSNNRLIINTYHPGNRSVDQESYTDQILTAFRVSGYSLS